MGSGFETHYFLGSNNRMGSYPLYEMLADPERGETLFILKGGRSSVRTVFLGKIADTVLTSGCSVEYIHSYEDPDSLDGIYLPDLKTAYIDGTAPHEGGFYANTHDYRSSFSRT